MPDTDHTCLACKNAYVYVSMYSGKNRPLNGFDRRDREVIGNVYENPELLKG